MSQTPYRNMFPREFISNTLIGTLRSMLPGSQSGYPYELFILISIGIEFLGACEDQHPWHCKKHGLSKERFLKGINLFSQNYHAHKDFLYEKLRCGMAHIFAPVSGLEIGENRHHTENLSFLGEGENKTICLNIESFFRDFQNACQTIIDKIDKLEYEKENKIFKAFLSVQINTNHLKQKSTPPEKREGSQ